MLRENQAMGICEKGFLLTLFAGTELLAFCYAVPILCRHNCICSFPIWCLWQAVVFDCIHCLSIYFLYVPLLNPTIGLNVPGLTWRLVEISYSVPLIMLSSVLDAALGFGVPLSLMSLTIVSIPGHCIVTDFTF